VINLPKVIGHRGAKDLVPENTLISINESIKYNVKWIEVDVKVSKDNIPFLLHDDLLDRTTTATGNPCNYLYKEIKTLDAGSWFDKKFYFAYPPSLNEVLSFCSNKILGINIELKPNKGKEKENVDAICSLINQSDLHFQYFFSSFDYFSLKLIREKKLNYPLSFLIHSIKDMNHLDNIISKCRKLECFLVGLDLSLISESVVRKLKENNLKISVFSNKSIDYKTSLTLWNIGINTIFVDNPKFFKDIIK
tara:strand:+ start:5 stop:754 length:750 start_codon:yes stop_codon:yes gene_type:complete